MTQTHPPIELDAPAPPAPAAMHLAYATPSPRKSALDVGDALLIVFRRIVFAAGVGFLVGGVVLVFDGARRDDPATAAGVGAGLIALVIPFRKLSEMPRLGRKD